MCIRDRVRPAVAEYTTGRTMGQDCDIMAARYEISRDQQDDFALRSHQLAGIAETKGYLKNEICEVSLEPKFKVIKTDNGIRPNSKIEKLASLRAAFDKKHGTLTAANSSFLTDGAAVSLIASESKAKELGLNPKIAKRAGLLHDMGKVPSIEKDIETPHALLGMQWAEKFGEKPDVCNAIGAHHDEIEMNCLISPIIQVCDAISGARPGARRQVLDSYIERLKNLEEIALDFNGVEKAYAIQAGRELRVIVESDKINDDEASNLSFQISQKIQTDMTYPGQVKVTVIRETRSVNIAK